MARAADTFPTLTSKRLRLRRFETGDLAGLHACFADQAAMRFWNFPSLQDDGGDGKGVALAAQDGKSL